MTKAKRPSNSMTAMPIVLWPVQPPKPSKPELTFLQRLATSVNFCIGYKIQRCHLPPDLQVSQDTHFLHQEILLMQNKLKTALKRDYEIQKGKILANRKKGLDKPS